MARRGGIEFPGRFPGAANRDLYVDEMGRYYAYGIDGCFHPVARILSNMFPDDRNNMGDTYYENEVAVPGRPDLSMPGIPPAPPGGWCFPIINGHPTAVACNQMGANSPQGTLLTPADVRSIQSRLNALMSAGLAVDGNYGPRTTAAVRNFQSRNGLPATGLMDAATRQRLFSGQQQQAGGQQNVNNTFSPPPGNSSLLSMFGGDSTLLILVVAVVAVSLRS